MVDYADDRPLPEAQERTTRRLVELKPHPRQDEFFSPLSSSELFLLAQSIERLGLQHPVHILPDGTILAGHQRVAAVKSLEWQEIDVIVRHDLVAHDTAAALFVIADNTHRRQMGPLELAFAYRALQEIERQDPSKRSCGGIRVDLRDRVAIHFKKSGRQLDRYVRLLELPAAVRGAISRRQLPVSTAEKLFLLSEDDRQLVAAQIDRGRDPKPIIGRMVRALPKAQNYFVSLAPLLKCLGKQVPKLEHCTGKLVIPNSEQIDLLERAQSIIAEIIRHSRKESSH